MPPPIMYIGKQELRRIPIFGYFYKHHCITIDRNNLKDSYNALNQAGEKINQGFNICIFPEGGIPISSIFLKKFKNGAFKLSAEKDVAIIPITLGDSKMRFPQEYYKGLPGRIRIKIHKPIKINKNQKNSVENLNKLVYNIIFDQLKEYESK